MICEEISINILQKWINKSAPRAGYCFHKPLGQSTWSATECFIVSPNFDNRYPRYILERATDSANSFFLEPLSLYRLQMSYSVDWGPWMFSRKEYERKRFCVTYNKDWGRHKVTNDIIHVSPTKILTENLPNRHQKYWRLSKLCYTTTNQLRPITCFALLQSLSSFPSSN